MKIKIKCDGVHKPTRGTEHSAGIDLYNNGATVTLMKGNAKTIQTKTSIEIPKGYVGLVFVRSGLGFRGLDLINSCGVIDADYRGEIGLKFVINDNDENGNIGEKIIMIEHGQRVAQIVIVPYLDVPIEFVYELDETERGKNGFGSTGK